MLLKEDLIRWEKWAFDLAAKWVAHIIYLFKNDLHEFTMES